MALGEQVGEVRPALGVPCRCRHRGVVGLSRSPSRAQWPRGAVRPRGRCRGGPARPGAGHPGRARRPGCGAPDGRRRPAASRSHVCARFSDRPGRTRAREQEARRATADATPLRNARRSTRIPRGWRPRCRGRPRRAGGPRSVSQRRTPPVRVPRSCASGMTRSTGGMPSATSTAVEGQISAMRAVGNPARSVRRRGVD